MLDGFGATTFLFSRDGSTATQPGYRVSGRPWQGIWYTPGRAMDSSRARRTPMRLVDLSHPWNLHTPGWIGYPGSKIYYTQTLQTNRIVSQRVETSLHVGTH